MQDQEEYIFNFTITGEPCSKANSRRIVRTKGGQSMVIKSQKALDYVSSFAKQCPTLDPLSEEDVAVEITIWYASRRPDLDESLILDCLQDKVYKNDRAVKEKHIYWGGVDKENPRAEIRVRHL
jgi:Holliday junction resolvase RusA-like endonuclease